MILSTLNRPLVVSGDQLGSPLTLTLSVGGAPLTIDYRCGTRQGTVAASLITGLLSLAGVVLSNLLSERRRENALRTAQAVTDEQLRELTREVREHNHFARRMPVVEEQIKVINHRLEDLEKGGA